MPKSTAEKLAYQKKYNAQPAIVKRREENNKARYDLMKAGKVSKGDGMDVAHVIALDSGGTDAKNNLKVESAKDNRNWRLGATRNSYRVPKDKVGSDK